MATDIKQTLNGWIDYSSPKLGTILQRMWKNQQQAITYKEIRQAIYDGTLDLKYLEQWRQDYSKFIVNGYAPLAQQAIDNSAKELAKKFGIGAKSLEYPYVDSFIAQKGGQLIREVSENQYKAVNVLVRQAAMSETMSVQDLAKAIRPTIGLTQRQSQAVLNYYQEAINNGYTPKVARDMQMVYAERMHRKRAETIAITEMAFAYNHGEKMYIQHCIADGLIGSARKQWLTADDERVCDECGGLDQEEKDLDEPFSNGEDVPPAHPRCRCVCNYIDVKPPADWTDNPQAMQGTQDIADEAEIPEDIDLSDVNYEHRINLGGTGEMHLITDNQTGSELLFKPAYKKYSTQVEEFRAYSQEAGYKVQHIIDPDTEVKIGTTTVDIPGRGQVFGAAQERIQNIDSTFDLKAWHNANSSASTSAATGSSTFSRGSSSRTKRGTIGRGIRTSRR